MCAGLLSIRMKEIVLDSLEGECRKQNKLAIEDFYMHGRSVAFDRRGSDLQVLLGHPERCFLAPVL